MSDLRVDAGMIGILPLEAVNRADASPEAGCVVKVAGGKWLSLQYDNGRIDIRVDNHGTIPVDEDAEWWIGDPCYVLENNIPVGKRGWSFATDPAPGYWSACIASLESPRFGQFTAQPYRLASGRLGLVANTMWGDGRFPWTLETCGAYMLSAVIETGDEDDDGDDDEL